MKRFLFLLFLSMFCIGLVEASLPDTLLDRLKRFEHSDKIDLLLEFGTRTLTTHPYLSEEAGLLALKLAQNQNNLIEISKVALFLGNYYHSTGRAYKKATYFYKKWVEFSSNEKPSMRAEVLMRLASSYLLEKEMDSARFFIIKATSVYKQLGDYEGYAAARGLASNIFLESKQIDSALSSLALACDAMENLIKRTSPDAPEYKRYLTRMADTKAAFANTWMLKGNYRIATGEINKALTYAVLSGNRTLQLRLSLDYANIYARQGAYEKSLEILLKILKDFEREENSAVVSEIWKRLGEIYAELGEMEKSQNNLRRAIELLNSAGNVAATASVYAVLGDGYFNQLKYDSAEACYLRSLAINRRFENMPGLMEDMVRMGHLAIAQGKMDQAEIYFREILHQAALLDSTLMTEAWKGMAQLNLKKNHYTAAIDFAMKAYRFAARVEDIKGRIEMADLLSKAYASKGDFKNAFQWLSDRTAWYDSLNLSGHKKEIARLQARYDFEKKETELELEKEKSRSLARTQRLILYFSVLGILFVVIIAWLLYHSEKERRLTEALNYRREAELARTRQALMEAEVKTRQLEQNQLMEDLKKQSVHLTNLALIIAQKNEFINQLKDQVKNLRQVEGEEKDKCMASLLHQINHQQRLNADLDRFRKEVEAAHQNFYRRLDEVCPLLTPHEKDLAGLLRIGLTSKDIASLNNVSVKAVEMSRYRLRKKLNLTTDESLVDFLQNLA